jgi:hypothetical protein
MAYFSHYNDWFEGFGNGKYRPDADEIVLSAALGKPYFTRTVLNHVTTYGKLVDKDKPLDVDGAIRVTGPTKQSIIAGDIKAEGSDTFDVRTLVKRHLVLTHELVHRRLTMDTSYGFLLRFYGLAKLYLEENENSLSKGELAYLEMLKQNFMYLMASWIPLHEYVASYSTWIEVHYLSSMVTAGYKLGKCDCSKEEFEAQVGKLAPISKSELTEYLKQFGASLARHPDLEGNPVLMRINVQDSDLPVIVESMKLDFIRLYLAVFLSSCVPLIDLDFTLISFNELKTRVEAYLPHNTVLAFIGLTEKTSQKHLVELMELVFCSDDREAKSKRHLLLGKADYFCRKQIKLFYAERIRRAGQLLGFEFFDYVDKHLKFWDEKDILWPMPRFTEGGGLERVAFMNSEDHFAFLTPERLNQAFGPADRPASDKKSISSRDGLFFDSYSINLIYRLLFSFTIYDSSPSGLGGFRLQPLKGCTLGELVSGGHDVGSLLNNWYC